MFITYIYYIRYDEKSWWKDRRCLRLFIIFA